MEETKTTTATPKKGGTNPILVAIIVVLVLAGLGYMIIQSNRDTAMTDTSATPTDAMQMTDGGSGTGSPTTAPVATSTESATTDGAMTDVKTIEVEAGSFYFKPNEIRVKKGQKVKIVMKAVSMMHDFTIDELNVKMPITKNGDTGTVEFTADQVGSFEYYCSVGQHKAQGQVGTLVVE